jgi:uncharacterized membrane protein YdbT with pleckstrin-like domain
MLEKTVWEGKPDWRQFALPLIIAAVLVTPVLAQGHGGALLLFAIVGGIVALKRAQCNFKVTDQRIISQYGLISRRTGELDVRDIRVINVGQSIIQRLFGIGTLEFTTSSGPAKEVMIIGIREPFVLKERIRALKQNNL